MRPIAVVFAFLIFAPGVFAQKSDISALFKSQDPLDMKLAISQKEMRKNTNDSTYIPAYLHLKNSGGGWDSVLIDIRARGLFRRENCYFTPIRIKIKKEKSKGTILEGNKSLKLVMPCQKGDDKNTLVMKEFLCYKFYEQLTPYYFNTRLVNLSFTETEGKKRKDYQLIAFLIEDDDVVAKRHNAKVVEDLKLHPMRLNDTSAVRHDLFQFMIANTDWSTTFYHNAKLIQKKPNTYIPLTYDFDMSGFVDAPYAIVNADLGISSVRERKYRGFCRNEQTVQYVRKDFLAQKQKIIDVLLAYQKDFSPRDFGDMKKYIEEFFDILQSDSDFKNYILTKCRNK